MNQYVLPRSYDTLHPLFYAAKEKMEAAKAVYESELQAFEIIRAEYMDRMGRNMAPECWQMMCASLTLTEKVMLANCSKFHHDEVVFGPNSHVFAWRDGVHDVIKPGASEKVIGQLVKAKADPNQQDDAYSRPILAYAAWNDRVDAVCALLAAGADVDGRDKYGWTTLMFATHPRVMDILLEAGADVNAVNNNGCTALMFACMDRDENTVRRLLAAHADVNVRDDRGWNALIYAIENDSTTVIPLLLKHGAVE